MTHGIDHIGKNMPYDSAKHMCFVKKIFDTRNDARDFAKRNLKREGWKDQTPYRCPICSKWHLTSLSKDDSAQARRTAWKSKDGDK